MATPQESRNQPPGAPGGGVPGGSRAPGAPGNFFFKNHEKSKITKIMENHRQNVKIILTKGPPHLSECGSFEWASLCAAS